MPRGRHRIRAAEEIFVYSDKRWVVDLYASGTQLPYTIRTKLAPTLLRYDGGGEVQFREDYASERKPDDGEFFYKIREYQGVFGHENPYFERRWSAPLAGLSTSTNKKDHLEDPFRRQKFASAFNALRHPRALYGGLRLITFTHYTLFPHFPNSQSFPSSTALKRPVMSPPPRCCQPPRLVSTQLVAYWLSFASNPRLLLV